MNTPVTHHLIIKDPLGKQIRGQVVHVEPNEASGRPASAVVHVVTSVWLGPHGYEAVYSTPSQSIAGRYTPRGYGHLAGEWLLMGTFDVTANSEHIFN